MRHRSIRLLRRTTLCTLLLATAVVCKAQEPAPNRILRPVDGAAIASTKIEGIAKLVTKGQLLLDGKPQTLLQKAPGVFTFVIDSAPGAHVIELQFEGGSEKVQFSMGPSPARDQWKPFRIHPPAATCETCHATRDNVWDFKHDKLETACSGCHDLKAFASGHQHNITQLADCAMCHNPHGSTAKFHMKYPRAVACKQCHG